MILERNKSDRFSAVIPEWQGATAVIIATGPSLTQDQVDAAFAPIGNKVIAVNDAYLVAPLADVCYFADSEWWRWQTEGRPKVRLGLDAVQVRERFENFLGQKCSIMFSGMNIGDDAVHIMQNMHGEQHGVGLSLDRTKLVTGRNSGFQAINLAILAGASTILLLGFDGKRNAAGDVHFFGDHPRLTPVDPFFEAMRRAFSGAEKAIEEAGVRVINCTPGSAINSFSKMTLEDALSL